MKRRAYLLIALLVSLIATNCVSTSHNQKIMVDRLGARTLKITRDFTPEETKIAYTSLSLISLIVPDISYVNYENIPLKWMKSNEFSGMSIIYDNAGTYIAIDESLRVIPGDSNWKYFYFGCTYAHELSHVLNHTDDPNTGKIINNRLLKAAFDHPELVSSWNPLIAKK